MGYTITEKILARAAGIPYASAGDEILAKPDFVLAYDFQATTDMFFRQMKEDFGIQRVAEPDRFGIFIDHFTTAPKPSDDALHARTRQWCEDNGVALFEHRGIGHQVASEVGFATPGAFVTHHDGHISQLGAFGVFAIGVRRRLIESFVRDRVSITVPASMQINFRGKLPAGVMARDVFHHLVRVLGPDGVRGQVMELSGDGLSSFTTEGLQTIAGLVMFTGAITAIVNPDAERLAYALPRARKKLEPVYSDPDAHYTARHDIDLTKLEPLIVIPPSPADTRDFKDYVGVEVQYGYVGSCVSGRLEDLRAAARVLNGRRVKPGFALHIVPTSEVIMAEAVKEGLISTLTEAGAIVSASNCDFCYGHVVPTKAGQRAVSTGTLNVRGRMGSIDSDIYIMNAAGVAAAAIEGRIVDPRIYG